jgi:hypothetical protein
MPSFETLPFIQNQNTCGFAEEGGLRKSLSSVEELSDEAVCAKPGGINENNIVPVMPVLINALRFMQYDNVDLLSGYKFNSLISNQYCEK